MLESCTMPYPHVKQHLCPAAFIYNSFTCAHCQLTCLTQDAVFLDKIPQNELDPERNQKCIILADPSPLSQQLTPIFFLGLAESPPPSFPALSSPTFPLEYARQPPMTSLPPGLTRPSLESCPPAPPGAPQQRYAPTTWPPSCSRTSRGLPTRSAPPRGSQRRAKDRPPCALRRWRSLPRPAPPRRRWSMHHPCRTRRSRVVALPWPWHSGRRTGPRPMWPCQR
mmetsp:Transcript_21750/g.44022  ORF Transcript_21750/g.44022 Transcript_21750/m.44022 type:complete len:224 (-) Transcript_21750:703-1374(-)